ncbi:hypothetical protein IWW54_000959 [Coemansia sp. RSA 2705]|nr:hypothetical protein IWW54_000959 [Coemansia sp. RSA 2705]
MASPEDKVSAVFRLLENGSKQGYIGEDISQLEHALQAALQATQEAADNETVLAALLHDVGQFCPAKELRRMLVEDIGGGDLDVGAVGHEKLGAEYLRKVGFSDNVCDLVESHVVAKRYLTATDPEYYTGLSQASKLSLKFQGGPFTSDEAEAFERDPLFKQKVQLRKWDDASKVVGMETPGLATYRKIAVEHLQQSTMFQDMLGLPKSLQQRLEKEYAIKYGRVVDNQLSADGTRKLLMQFNDDPRASVETVIIPEERRGTLCVSSQVGCSLTCRFCHTGTQRLYRNLTAPEIVGQYMTAAWMAKDLPRRENHQRAISNIVFMGQGEPLYNFRNVSAAISLLTDRQGIGLAPWRIVISTSGVAPLIPRIASELHVGLAVSLHSADNDTRSEIMPINRTYPLQELMHSCKEFARLAGPQNRRITFEYVMLDRVNDSDADARRLVDLIKALPAHVNLIPFNPWPGSVYRASSPARVAEFCTLICRLGIHASVRTPRGDDILAACGQLKSARGESGDSS